ncbi:MAG: PAS domain S-box protein [Nitrospiraceae bacterium]|nr:PAS domain S-box protein [Nitrospiraceae bacterium]
MLDEIFGIGRNFTRSFEGWLNIVHPRQREEMLEYFTNHVLRDRHPFDREYLIVRVLDNSPLWVHGIGNLEYGDDGQPVRMFGTIQDINRNKLAEEKLQKSEEFTRNILDTVDEGFIVIDREYRILTANKAYCSQAGGFYGEIIGRHCYEISHKLDRPCADLGEECAVRQVFETGNPHSSVHCHKNSGGKDLFIESKAYPVRDASGAVTSAIETIIDITEKHLLEEERLKTQKLESIGTLAGGIAHDFNNLLQGIFGYISMAKMAIDRKERVLSMLEQAEEALHLSVTLSTQLLTFSKGGRPSKKLIRIQNPVENAVKFALSGSNCSYEMDIPADLRAVEADEGQVAQVIQNIVLNANEAMAGSGTVLISLSNMDVAKDTIAGLQEGGGVRAHRHSGFRHRDTGTGPVKDLRPLFHHKTERQRTRTGNLILDHKKPRRRDRGKIRTEQRHNVQRLPSRGQGR